MLKKFRIKIYLILSFLSAISPVSPSAVAPEKNTKNSSSSYAGNQTGVPMSADDFLNAQ